MTAQGLGGDIVYIASKNARLRRARTTSRTPRPRPTRPTRCGCWPPSWASTASGSTASTRTGWCAAPGSSRAAGARSARRRTAIEEEKLGEFYAQRTLLKREVLPEHVANAVFALTGGDLTHTTGLHIPVDAGVAARLPALTAADRVGSDAPHRAPVSTSRPPPSPRSTSARPAGASWSAASGPDALELDRGAPLPEPAGADCPTGCAGTSSRCTAGVLDGLRAAGRAGGRLARVGIDSWAVDYGLLDADGALLGNPVHYRDARTEGVAEKVWATVPRRRAVRGDRAAVRAVQHRSTSWSPARDVGPTGRRRAAVADPRPALVLADGRGAAPS